MNKLAVFASGSGTNAQKLYDYFKDHQLIEVNCILSNKASAYVLERAKNMQVETLVFNRQQLFEEDFVLNYLSKREVDWIILAGFLWLIPEKLIQAYPNRIINIHPALLPKYGGKGMYGSKVHEAVIANKESESGISIHYVNKKFDEGEIIFQAKCSIGQDDTAEDLAQKIHTLEHTFFPKIVEKVVLDNQM
ncbi:MAG: phosphoribosylglycinamide formyltransferase [Bacteroidales bacterium]|nr:phosphoribosylglycinamide formyltransferase [Bacteroidales bacterium]MCF8455404.1 phosphoribosylglycinamide formyltransferase [Bacteroidales bacterium]